LLDLADFLMHHWYPVPFFDVSASNPGCAQIQPHTCVCNICIISSFVIDWQFRRIDHNGSRNPYLLCPPKLYI